MAWIMHFFMLTPLTTLINSHHLTPQLLCSHQSGQCIEDILLEYELVMGIPDPPSLPAIGRYP
ncbi:unnamed protein product [Ilex paraguariensis]|uniref:Uncharacterized protein n=1 Tax=Ilex paraguariensis TaxID=185542 RepID=A0ABC8UXJ0_9AQUA